MVGITANKLYARQYYYFFENGTPRNRRISFSALVVTFGMVLSTYRQLDLVVHYNSYVMVSLWQYIWSIHHYYFRYSDKRINYASCKPPWVLSIPVGIDNGKLLSVSLKETILLRCGFCSCYSKLT